MPFTDLARPLAVSASGEALPDRRSAAQTLGLGPCALEIDQTLSWPVRISCMEGACFGCVLLFVVGSRSLSLQWEQVRRSEQLVGRWRCVEVPHLDCRRRAIQLELLLELWRITHICVTVRIPALLPVRKLVAFQGEASSQSCQCLCSSRFQGPDVVRAGLAWSP